jgi:hypothetical protein
MPQPTPLKRLPIEGNSPPIVELHRSSNHASNAGTGNISTLLLSDALADIEVKAAIEAIAGENYQNAPVLLSVARPQS